ncbi:MAG: hypothetical protein J6B07_03365 [Opitutales bacterium]|nr:hypothetical protein [Opitutales bacterium]
MSTKLTEKDKQKIIQILNSRIPNLECPMCKNKNFIILDGYFNDTIANELKVIAIGGTTIPSIGIVCGKCGFISRHALGIFGLLKEEENGEKQTK